MEDKYAKKDGEDAHVKVVTKFWRYDPKVGTTAAASFSERLKVKLVKNDKKLKANEKSLAFFCRSNLFYLLDIVRGALVNEIVQPVREQ